MKFSRPWMDGRTDGWMDGWMDGWCCHNWHFLSFIQNLEKDWYL